MSSSAWRRAHQRVVRGVRQPPRGSAAGASATRGWAGRRPPPSAGRAARRWSRRRPAANRQNACACSARRRARAASRSRRSARAASAPQAGGRGPGRGPRRPPLPARCGPPGCVRVELARARGDRRRVAASWARPRASMSSTSTSASPTPPRRAAASSDANKFIWFCSARRSTRPVPLKPRGATPRRSASREARASSRSRPPGANAAACACARGRRAGPRLTTVHVPPPGVPGAVRRRAPCPANLQARSAAVRGPSGASGGRRRVRVWTRRRASQSRASRPPHGRLEAARVAALGGGLGRPTMPAGRSTSPAASRRAPPGSGPAAACATRVLLERRRRVEARAVVAGPRAQARRRRWCGARRCRTGTARSVTRRWRGAGQRGRRGGCPSSDRWARGAASGHATRGAAGGVARLRARLVLVTRRSSAARPCGRGAAADRLRGAAGAASLVARRGITGVARRHTATAAWRGR